MEFGYRNAQLRTGDYSTKVLITKEDFKDSRKQLKRSLKREGLFTRLNRAYKDHSYAYTGIATVVGLALTGFIAWYGFKHIKYQFDLQNFRDAYIKARSATSYSSIPLLGGSLKEKAAARASIEVNQIIQNMRGWSIPLVKEEIIKKWHLPLALIGDEIEFGTKKTINLLSGTWCFTKSIFSGSKS